MNRFKLEQQRKHNALRAGLSEHEIKRLDRDEAVKAEIFKLAEKIHRSKYPEEYCHTLDDHVDHAQRKKGINPMSEEYISSVAHKRAEAGVSPLSKNGMPVSDDTWKIAYAEAEALVRG